MVVLRPCEAKLSGLRCLTIIGTEGSLADEGGAYIIASSGTNASDSALASRRNAMVEALAGVQNADALMLDFLDRSRLATWLRNHPGLVPWVRQRIGRSLQGWRSYDAWAYSPDGVKDAYLTDDKRRVHGARRDGDGEPIAEGIKRLRAALSKPRGVVRLAELSGVGKTRLVQVLFDARVGDNSLDPALTVYTDMADGQLDIRLWGPTWRKSGCLTCHRDYIDIAASTVTMTSRMR